MKLIFAPIGIVSGLLAGWVAQKTFERLWAFFDEEEAPEPGQRDASLPKLAAALVARRAFAGFTGSWPGEDAPDRV
jgi:hypothetical protein